MKTGVRRILLIVFVIIFVVSAFFFMREYLQRRKAVQYINNIEKEYTPSVIKKPEIKPVDKPEETLPEDPDEPKLQENPSVKDLCAKYPDVIGWLTCDAVDVSMPFVYSSDNNDYLRADLDKNYLVTGTLFLDYRNSRDMDDVVSVIYGHNMKNGTMFADLNKFRNQTFLEEHPDVFVSYPDYTTQYKVYASMMVDAEDCVLYEYLKTGEITPEEVKDYIKSSNAFVNDSIEIDENSRFLVLSTCSPEFFYARTIVVCVLDSIY